MMSVKRLDWRPDRIEHIARHHVSPYEVEEVVFDDPLMRVEKAGPAERNPDETIYRIYGRTEAGRYLCAVLLEHESGDTALPLTARDMTNTERRRYIKT